MPKVNSAHFRPIETLPLQNQIHEDKIYCVMIYFFEKWVWILITKFGLLPVHCRLSAAGQAET